MSVDLEESEENIKNKPYHTLIYLFGENAGENVGETTDAFAERIKTNVEFNLMNYVAEISGAIALLDINKNNGILENIAYFGLLRKTENLLKKGVSDTDE